ncbi:hypothetical protein A2U01_0100451, partial [Trifolium medium]|nr:hypothetical protein [Trifolium medium]
KKDSNLKSQPVQTCWIEPKKLIVDPVKICSKVELQPVQG